MAKIDNPQILIKAVGGQERYIRSWNDLTRTLHRGFDLETQKVIQTEDPDDRNIYAVTFATSWAGQTADMVFLHGWVDDHKGYRGFVGIVDRASSSSIPVGLEVINLQEAYLNTNTMFYEAKITFPETYKNGYCVCFMADVDVGASGMEYILLRTRDPM